MKENEEQKQIIDEFQAKIEYLEQELSLKKDLSSIQLEEFQTLRKSNENLSEMLEGLQSRFTKVNQAEKKMQEVKRK